MKTGPALAAFAALLDRSFVQIEEAARDGRTFDRELINGVADVWDNNMLPFFRAATTSTRWRRERYARAALRWMADLGPGRYAWMAEQSETAGHPLAGFVRPPARGVQPYRDYNGHIWSSSVSLSPEAFSDYDLTDCEIRSLRIELTGERLGAVLKVDARRRFEAGEDGRLPAELSVYLHNVAEAEFEAGSTASASLSLSVGPGHAELSLGPAGRLVGTRAEVSVNDSAWHLTAAGRAAEALLPARDRDRGVRSPWPPLARRAPAGRLAGRLLRAGMVAIRRVRMSGTSGQRAVLSLTRAFSGAGQAVLDAAPRGEAGFRELIEGWVRRGDATFADWLRSDMPLWCLDLPKDGGTRGWIHELVASLPATEPPPTEPPSSAALRLLSLTTAGTRYLDHRPAWAVVHLASPPLARQTGDGDGWRMGSVEFDSFDRLRLRPGAFTTPGRVEYDRAGLVLSGEDGEVLFSVSGTGPGFRRR